jgi:uncharacterized protein YcbK (DUF882 family)
VKRHPPPADACLSDDRPVPGERLRPSASVLRPGAPAAGRRRLLLAAAAAPLAGLARPAFAAPARLALLNTHTGERLDLVYREAGDYVPEAMSAIDHLLRDHRTGDVFPIDRQLLDLLHTLAGRLEAAQPFHVISGYRSPATNAKLAAASDGVARASLHLQGRAIDIRLPGHDLEQLRRAALSLQAGGVGFYRRSDFVHVDTGRVRSW